MRHPISDGDGRPDTSNKYEYDIRNSALSAVRSGNKNAVDPKEKTEPSEFAGPIPNTANIKGLSAACTGGQA